MGVSGGRPVPGDPSVHTRTSTDEGPDFCDECSHAADNWVTWPCSAIVAETEAPEGPFRVVRHWSRWSIEDVLDPWRMHPVFDTEAEAAAEAERRNVAYAARRSPRRVAQVEAAHPSLFGERGGAA